MGLFGGLFLSKIDFSGRKAKLYVGLLFIVFQLGEKRAILGQFSSKWIRPSALCRKIYEKPVLHPSYFSTLFLWPFLVDKPRV